MCVAVIVAPGRAAPLSSSTAPRSSAWATCAEPADGSKLNERTRSGNTRRRDIQLLLEGRGRVAVAVRTTFVSTARRDVNRRTGGRQFQRGPNRLDRTALLHARETCLCALVDDGQVALNAVGADDIGMWIAGFPPLERRQLGLGPVEDRVVRDQHIGAGVGGDILEA